jgi:hypothetical protein
MDVDPSQWLSYVVSALFGGVGGIGAGIAKFKATMQGLEDRLTAVEKEQALQKERDRERLSGFDEFKESINGRVDELKAAVNGRLKEIKNEVVTIRTDAATNQKEIERSLGSIEGTVNMIAKNGCAARCSPARHYPSGDAFPAGGKPR